MTATSESDGEEGEREKSIETPYGWVVAVAAFILQVLVIGCTAGYGIIYVEFLEYFEQTRSATSGIAALCQLFLSFGGVVSSWTTPRFGHRRTLLAGSLIASVGLFSSGFAPNVFYLYATYGIIGGFGFGICYVGSLSLVAQYFDKRRSLATSVAMAGGGVSYFVFPITVKSAIQTYTVRGAMVILSCMWLQGCVCAALMRSPVGREVCIEKKENEDAEIEMETYESNSLLKTEEKSASDSDDLAASQGRGNPKSKPHSEKNSCSDIQLMESQTLTADNGDTRRHSVEHMDVRTETKTSRCPRLAHFFKGSVILEWNFWVWSLAIILYRIDFQNFPHIAPDFALLTGHGKFKAHLLMNILGGCLIPARLLGGHILDRPWANVFIIMIGSLLLFGAISLVFPFVREIYWLMAVMTGLRGALQGIVAIFPVPVNVALFGVERISSALAYSNMCKGFGDLLSAPLAASIYDYTGDYLLDYVTCACMCAIASGLIFVLFLHSKGIIAAKSTKKGPKDIQDDISV